jgi:hypothetical protein
MDEYLKKKKYFGDQASPNSNLEPHEANYIPPRLGKEFKG